MKYAVVQVVNGNCSVVAEGFSDANKARITYHNTCKNLYGDIANVHTMAIMIIDNLGNIIEKEWYDEVFESSEKSAVEE